MIKSTDEDEEAITGLLDTDAKTNSETTGTSGGSSDGNKESIVMGGTDIPLCGILSVKFYKPYFDVDTKDITNRLYHALVSFKVSLLYLVIPYLHNFTLKKVFYSILSISSL